MVTNMSTYWLNRGKKYRSNCHQCGIKKRKKEKIHKIEHQCYNILINTLQSLLTHSLQLLTG